MTKADKRVLHEYYTVGLTYNEKKVLNRDFEDF